MVSVAVKKYDLPDSYLYDNNIDIPLIKVWIPENICIVDNNISLEAIKCLSERGTWNSNMEMCEK